VRTRRLPWWTGSLSAAVLSVVVAACGGSTTTPSANAPVAPSASAAATPAVSAGAVKAAYLDALADPKFSATATLSGTIALAGINGEVSGKWSFIGRDAHRTTTISLPGNEQTTETIALGPDGWERKGDGPWLEQEKAADPSKSFTGSLAILNSLEDRGVESREGVDLYHFQPANGGAIPAAALGLDNPDIKDPKVTADFYATAEGVPAAFDFHITWTQAIGGQDAPVTMDMQIDIDEVGSPESIDPPAKDEIWTRYKSSFGYTMAHPPDWTVKHARTEDSYLLDNQGYVYVAPQSLPSGEKLSSFQSGLITFYKGQFNTEPDSKESTSIGGSPAFRLVYHFKNEANQDVALVDVGTVHAGKGWEVFMLTLAGDTEADDIAVFDDFVTTFTFTK
jgi:hypothetical protein